MLNFFKNIFFKDNANQDFKPGSNKYFIEKYKEFDEIIKTYYQAKDRNGKVINIDGLVVPLKIDNRQTFSVIDLVFLSTLTSTSEIVFVTVSICACIASQVVSQIGDVYSTDVGLLYTIFERVHT